MDLDLFSSEVFNLKSEKDFENMALKVYFFQYQNNLVYQNFAKSLKKNPDNVVSLYDIPFLPIEFYKTHNITSVSEQEQLIFRSSGTSGQIRSINRLYSEELYQKSIYQCFKDFYGDPEKYLICALVPSLEKNPQSSLAYMLNFLIKLSGHDKSGFYLDNKEKFIKITQSESEIPKLIFGITHTLLEFAEEYQFPLENTIIIETGGMKGMRKESTRDEIHSFLHKTFSCEVHSEYSMSELMSQAYAKSGNKFYCPKWMKVLIRDINDPFSYVSNGITGGINIIDLANFNTCSFLETKDLGKHYVDDSFEITGRFDNSDTRGCNLMSVEA